MPEESNVTPQVSIILIRESAEQMTGSGCCGRLEGDSSLTGGAAAYRNVRREQEAFGVLHRAVAQFYADEIRSGVVTIRTVDPRNQPYLFPKLCKDVWRHRPGWGRGLCTLLQLYALPAVIVNGRVISRRGRPLDPDALCHEVGRILAASKTQPLSQEHS